MLDKKCNFALCISKNDEESMCEFQFEYAFISPFDQILGQNHP